MATEIEDNLPLSIEDLKKKRRKLLKSAATPAPKGLDKVAVWITAHVGSMGFFIIIFIWTAAWLSWNILAPTSVRFDPYPAFVLWLFMSNMIQLFLMPLIMIGQNVQSKESDARAEADLKINSQAELEIETILLHLEMQNRLILKILKSLEKKDQ